MSKCVFSRARVTTEDFEEGTVSVYPSPTERKPKIEIPYAFEEDQPHRSKVTQIYKETLNAWNHGAEMLAAAGLRALVEAVCLDQGCTQGNLAHKIEALITKGVLLKRDADYLHTHRLLGNEAVHEMEAPPSAEFEFALQILEHLLATIYVLPHLDQRLRKMRSQRGAQVQ
jgi:hypothetical protein